MNTIGAEHDETRLVHIAAERVSLEGTLAMPVGARGVIVCAHCCGRSRHGPRNRFVAQSLRSRARLGTLLVDLLSEEEEEIDLRTHELRFDVAHLAKRLMAATDWLRATRETSRLPVGFFGTSTGAAATLVAAAERDDVAAIVSRGGRPELAGAEVLTRVRAPTLLIVGGEDAPLIDMNRTARSQMTAAHCELSVISGASHHFEEPGALEEVARHAASFFARHCIARDIDAARDFRTRAAWRLPRQRQDDD